MIEFDLRTTQDKTIVICHDEKVADHTISQSTLAGLVAVKPDLITLDQALQAIPKSMPLNLEVKPGADASIVIEAIKKITDRSIVVSSFDFKLVRQIHETLPGVPVAVLESKFGTRARRRADKLQTKRVHFKASALWFLYIWLADRGGWEIYAYTVNNPHKAYKWERWGLKGVFTDYPDRFLPKKS
jgi:glycerophosphoryl diester phosphodiesterase